MLFLIVGHYNCLKNTNTITAIKTYVIALVFLRNPIKGEPA